MHLSSARKRTIDQRTSATSYVSCTRTPVVGRLSSRAREDNTQNKRVELIEISDQAINIEAIGCCTHRNDQR